MNPAELVTDQHQLEQFCEHARQHQLLAIDTEFVRTRTLFAKLGLIQARSGDEVVLIDPIAGLDLAPFWKLLPDPDVVKVIHAGGEDYEIFWQKTGELPNNLFDSQVAAAFAEIGDAMGYAALVEHYFSVTLDKSQSRTDWLKRPLTDSQLTYAAADVQYLYDIYPKLLAMVEEKGHYDLVLAESSYQAKKRAQQVPTDLLYLFIGNAWQLDPQQLAVLKELAAWRQTRAEQENIPLSFVAKEHVVMELARKLPERTDKLYSITDLPPMTRKYAGDELIALISKARESSEADAPAPLYRLTDMPGYKNTFNAIKAHIQTVANKQQIPIALIASRRQINDIIHWAWQIPPEFYSRLPQPDLFADWRGAILREPLEKLLQR
ncbi:ribonuclease D [Pseudidiomarina planktonica]|uniref:Ribonuclease D n=1 Tax=Pseudidiomarina planktonica TaxID=1323738 RepID=A0A1Y6F7N0_9GAMM|nr:ribonuclease D [Pseudidiomarina planktonica]RUO64976.1 ribonuclease D [Pseudidiomarina planktonica]SMQ68712.1 ribonuclease D [Pseudidiomarina planktonica]